jgi:hypothetical protein
MIYNNVKIKQPVKLCKTLIPKPGTMEILNTYALTS